MNNPNPNSKALVSSISIGSTELEVLMLPDGSFAVAVPQIAALFSFSNSHASRDIKALMGKDFSFSKVSSELNSKPVNILTLLELEIIATKLDRAGNLKARDFKDCMFGLALHQLACDAFNIKFEKQDRAKWLKERQESKCCRLSLTDATKFLVERGEKLNYGQITLQTYQLCGLVKKYRHYKVANKDDKFRDTLSEAELRRISKFEENTADYVLVDNQPLNDAMLRASRYVR